MSASRAAPSATTARDAELVIRVEHLTKRYRIYPTPADRLRDALGWRCTFKEFAALDDVSLTVHRGEFWGIVGKNGSGKSTLLKLVAGLVQPTGGTIECCGKLALLQLGIGFDPEQTGLENIKQSRLLQNLRSDYDEVVEFVRDFSELGDFIDYPVKTYSSGMYSRLAFATAIAGSPDVLIADEVLAVGDMNFAQKCLAKMREFKEQGKTVLLVTHDINAVRSFCDLGAWLNEGRLMSVGPAKMIAEDFRNFMIYGVISGLTDEAKCEPENGSPPEMPAAAATPSERSNRPDGGWVVPKPSRRTVASGKVDLLRYRFIDWSTREPLVALGPGRAIVFEISFRVARPTDIHSFAFTLHDRNGLIAAHLNSEFFGAATLTGQAEQEGTACFRFDVPMLAAGDYSLSFGCSEAPEGTLIEKFDHDSAIAIEHPKSSVTDRQGGYVVIAAGEFEYREDA